MGISINYIVIQDGPKTGRADPGSMGPTPAEPIQDRWDGSKTGRAEPATGQLTELLQNQKKSAFA